MVQPPSSFASGLESFQGTCLGGVDDVADERCSNLGDLLGSGGPVGS